MNLAVGSRVLVTTNNWFYGPDGREYRAVFGTVKGVHDDQETLGIRTNRNSTNWYAEIGCAVIAGCQIQYVVLCEQPPPDVAPNWSVHDGKVVVTERPTTVFNADGGKA